MATQVRDLLERRRQELVGLGGAARDTWHRIETWYAKTRPLIADHFANQVDALDTLMRIEWQNRRTLEEMAAGVDVTEDLKQNTTNNRLASDRFIAIVGFMDALIELCGVEAIPEADIQESHAIFTLIDRMIAGSLLTPEFQTIVASDVEESRKSYSGKAYKSCVVMLGAALEGLMLGTLVRPDVIAWYGTAPSIPGAIQSLGTRDPMLREEIGDKLGFEDYKNCIHDLIPATKTLRVDDIQSFRNAVHPWKSITDRVFGDFDRTRALHYIASFQKIVEAIHQWAP